MRLAEALLLRAEYQKKLDNLQQRILMNLKVQENEKPFENPEELLAESLKINEEMCELINKINKRNHETILENGQTISEAIAERDSLLKKRRLLSLITEMAAQQNPRLTHAEVKMQTTLDIGKLQKEIDDLSKRFRLTDTQIQAKNWTVDL